MFMFTANNPKEDKPNPPPPQRNNEAKQETKRPAPPAPINTSPIMLPLHVVGKTLDTAAPNNLTTVTPQPVIVNNQVLLYELIESFERENQLPGVCDFVLTQLCYEVMTSNFSNCRASLSLLRKWETTVTLLRLLGLITLLGHHLQLCQVNV